jgi:multicomponent Na+:H+ antiporter subunit F
MIALVATGGASFALCLVLVRLLAGPTLYDRALAAMAAGFLLALIGAALAVSAGRSDFLDVAFAIFFSLFVTSAAVLKYFRVRSLQPPMAPSRREVA